MPNQHPRETRLPPPVVAGDRVGVAALSGPVDAAALELGVARLRELGFDPVLAENLGSRQGLFAGGDEERLRAFHQLASEPEVKAIFFARGGHGVLRLLPGIDWELLARHPRAYVGYSDVTLFLNRLATELGIATFHGPMAAVELAREQTEAERESLLSALRGEPSRRVDVEPIGDRPFEVRGPLLGGCLSLLASGLGTEHRLAPEGAILFWEDVNEPLYRIDRMLTQLRLSGTLNSIRGMVVGRVDVADAAPSGAFDIDLQGLLNELERVSDWPIAVGCSSGHCEPNFTLTLGVEATLSSSGTLTMG